MGYTGGRSSNPTYESVCGGDGHTEAMRVWFDPSVTSYEALLERFFRDHDPTRRSKPQYKSALWYHSPEQQQAAQALMASMEAKFGVKLATSLGPEQPWYDAEEYHQLYIQKSMGGAARW